MNITVAPPRRIVLARSALSLASNAIHKAELVLRDEQTGYEAEGPEWFEQALRDAELYVQMARTVRRIVLARSALSDKCRWLDLRLAASITGKPEFEIKTCGTCGLAITAGLPLCPFCEEPQA